jgi:hypothetical protein
MSDARKYTTRLLDMVEEGILDKDNVILACVKYMSESDVEDMMRVNDMIIDDESEEEEVNDEDE